MVQKIGFGKLAHFNFRLKISFRLKIFLLQNFSGTVARTAEARSKSDIFQFLWIFDTQNWNFAILTIVNYSGEESTKIAKKIQSSDPTRHDIDEKFLFICSDPMITSKYHFQKVKRRNS